MVGDLMIDLLQQAAGTGRLSDIRALYLAPRIILAPLQRGGVKHEGQVKAVIRDRIALWPNIPPPQPQFQQKRGRPKRNIPARDKLSIQKESMVEQAIRDKALSKRLANC